VLEKNRTGVYRVKKNKEGMKAIYGKDNIIKGYPDYLNDESNVHGEEIEALFFPGSVENVSYIVNEAVEKGKCITVSGGRTGICAGAVPEGGYVISLEKMTKILDLSINYGEYELKAESGIRLSDINNLIRSKDLKLDSEVVTKFKMDKKNYFYPPDPTETSATLGGSVATNASGARSFFYGPTRNYVKGIEVILPSGELLKIKRGDIKMEEGFFNVQREYGSPLKVPSPCYEMPKTKHSCGLFSKKGMDLIDLFIGSEGILGIIVNITVRLLVEPEIIFGGVTFFSNEDDAVNFVINARENGIMPLALEYFDKESLLFLNEVRKGQGNISEIPEIPDFGGAVYLEFASESSEELKKRLVLYKYTIEKYHGDPSTSWAALQKRDIMRLKFFRHTLPETINGIIANKKIKENRIHKVGTDMSVPDDYLKEIMSFYREVLNKEGIKYVIFGHIGNNHLHVNMIPDSYNELLKAKEIYKRFAEKAVSFGGSVAAEHGIGKIKKQMLKIQYPESAVDEMRTIKKYFDPLFILNRGNVI